MSEENKVTITIDTYINVGTMVYPMVGNAVVGSYNGQIHECELTCAMHVEGGHEYTINLHAKLKPEFENPTMPFEPLMQHYKVTINGQDIVDGEDFIFEVDNEEFVITPQSISELWDRIVQICNENVEIIPYPIVSPITIPISAEVKNYLDFINYLLVDILESPTTAMQFTQNPETYAVNAGFTPDVVANVDDDGLIRMIVTLADSEIRNAVLNNDVPNFLRLCKEKQVFKSIGSNGGISSVGVIGLDPEIQAIINATMGDDEVVGFFSVATVIAVAFFLVAAVAIATVAIATVTRTETQVSSSKVISPDPAHEFVLQLWYFNGGSIDQTHALLSEYQEQQIDLVIESLQENFPEKFAGLNKDNIKEFMALNIQKISE